MDNVVERLAAFFAEYEARTNRALADPPDVDVEATVEAFANCFVGASPAGVQCGKNDQEFREAIPKGLQFYRSIGTQRMNIVAIATTRLDDLHAMSRVSWKAEYIKKDSSPTSIEFDVIYLTQLSGDEPRIFCYITGDEQQAYKDHGLI